MIHTRIVQGIGRCGEKVDVHVSLHRVLVSLVCNLWSVCVYDNDADVLFIIVDYDGYSCKGKWDAFMRN